MDSRKAKSEERKTENGRVWWFSFKWALWPKAHAVPLLVGGLALDTALVHARATDTTILTYCWSPTIYMPRQHERVPFLTEVVLEFASGKREARISDLSEGGCYVESWAGVNPGDTVRFEMQTPAGESLPVVGEVTHAFEGMGFGVKFLDMNEAMRLRIRELVEAEKVAV